MINGLLVMAIFLGLSYSQTGSGSTKMPAFSAPTEWAPADAAGDHEIAAAVVHGADTTSTAESLKLLMVGSVLILIGTTLKKMRKKMQR